MKDINHKQPKTFHSIGSLLKNFSEQLPVIRVQTLEIRTQDGKTKRIFIKDPTAILRRHMNLEIIAMRRMAHEMTMTPGGKSTTKFKFISSSGFGRELYQCPRALFHPNLAREFFTLKGIRYNRYDIIECANAHWIYKQVCLCYHKL